MQPHPAVVLLFDDHEDSLAMYATELLETGVQLIVAETAEEAYERACAFHPDVVVADGRGSTGLDLTRRLREDPRTKDTGIVVLTGYGDSSMQQQAEAAGCDRFVLKPCLPDALVREIRRVLTSRRSDTANVRPLHEVRLKKPKRKTRRKSVSRQQESGRRRLRVVKRRH